MFMLGIGLFIGKFPAVAPLKFITAGKGGRAGGEDQEYQFPRINGINPASRRAGFLWNDSGPWDPHWLRLSS